MRGKQRRKRNKLCSRRITPADAGKTYFKNNAKTLDEDHPRGCGENPPELSQMNTNIGSPPRMRGKHSRRCHRGKSARITPADAGKTVKVGRPEIRDKDHPRRCGENQKFTVILCLLIGSPPQVRGKQCAALTRFNCFRITPAGAGKTLLIGMPFCQLWDHPRRCGENRSVV